MSENTYTEHDHADLKLTYSFVNSVMGTDFAIVSLVWTFITKCVSDNCSAVLSSQN